MRKTLPIIRMISPSLASSFFLHLDLLDSKSTFPPRLLSLMGAVISTYGVGFGFLLTVMRFVYGTGWAAEGAFTHFAVQASLFG